MDSSLLSLIPFLQFCCSCQFRRLDSIQFTCYQAHIPAGWPLETQLFTLCCLIELFFITTSHGSHGKHRLLLSRIVSGVSTAPLHSNGRDTDHIQNSLCIVEACLSRAHVYRVVFRNGCTRHNMFPESCVDGNKYKFIYFSGADK
jgi:hypothetical protein